MFLRLKSLKWADGQGKASVFSEFHRPVCLLCRRLRCQGAKKSCFQRKLHKSKIIPPWFSGEGKVVEQEETLCTNENTPLFITIG